MIFLFANIAAGAALLLAGRRLFWLFVAITGFLVGAEVTGDMFVNQPRWVVWVLAAGASIIGAVLAMLLQRIAFAVAGFMPAVIWRLPWCSRSAGACRMWRCP